MSLFPPDDAAVIDGERVITRAAWQARTAAIAAALGARGIGVEARVAVLAERSFSCVAAVRGVLEAGAAYVPLDPAMPRERLRWILDDSGATLILATPLTAALAFALGESLVIDGISDAEARAIDAPPEALACVIYTSGSTGRPKGVMVTRGALANHAAAIVDRYRLTPADRVLQFASPAFDVFGEEVFPTLRAGAAVVIGGRIESFDDWTAFVERSGITVLNLPAGYWRELTRWLDESGTRVPPSLRLMVAGSEAVDAGTVERWLRIAPAVEWANAYGPTETTITATVFGPTRGGVGERVPIGWAIGGAHVHVIDGEICIGGRGVARGYHGSPDRTAAAFVPHPLRPGERLYRTGDRGRIRADGAIEFLGRGDSQVKIRGYRIELQEIESLLRQQPGVRDAVVVVAAERLVAYVAGAADANALRDALRASLPEYMIPAGIVLLDAIPRNANGKVDRERLPAWQADEAPYIAPANATEEALARIWCEVLGVARAGRDDDFFRLGGDSIAAMRIVSRVRAAMPVGVNVSDVFNHPRLSELADAIIRTAAAAEPCPIVPVDRTGRLPLSPFQEAIWFTQQFDRSSIAYISQAVMRLSGALSIDVLNRALTEICRRHECLRTTFHEEDGLPYQRVHAPQPVEATLVDLTAFPPSTVEEFLAAEYRAPFQLDRLPLVRWTLFRTGEHEHLLTHVEHHLVHDGWSSNVFVGELVEAYGAYAAGREPRLPALPLQFGDFAVWHRTWLGGDGARREIDYWKRALTPPPPPLELPADRPRPAVQRFRGDAVRFEIGIDDCDAVRALARREQVSVFVAMLAAFDVVMHRLSGQDDFAVGTGFANRRWPETEPLIGLLLNTAALRVRINRSMPLREVLRRTRDAVVEAASHEQVPFNKVVEVVCPGAAASGNPLFQVAFAFHNAPMPRLDVPGLRIGMVEAPGNGSAKFDVNVIVIAHSEELLESDPERAARGMTVVWEYNSDLFERATAEAMVGHFRRVLEAMIRDAGVAAGDVDLLSAGERAALLAWNPPAPGFAQRCLHELIEEQAARQPEVTAVVCGEARITYGELDRRSDAVAAALQARGVRLEDRVGVALPRSIEAIVAMLGVLKAGAAYVPLDPALPVKRLRYMLDTADAAALLTNEALAATLGSGVPVMLADRPIETGAARTPVRVRNDNLAYVLYTSGSTGVPKGVACTHDGVVNMLEEFQRRVPVTRGSQVALWASLSFDTSGYEIYGALVYSGTLHIAVDDVRMNPERLFPWLRDSAIEFLFLPPFMLMNVLSVADGELPLRRIMVGAESVQYRTFAALQRLAPRVSIINSYGPTETTICSTLYTVDPVPESDDIVPIGRIFPNCTGYVVDEALRLVPRGVAGELILGGMGVARGYINRPELTAERFVPDPFGPPGSRVYRTGDIVRILADGEIRFIGRVDRQVKLRGLRIELEEVEAALLLHPEITHAAALVTTDDRGERHLVAYVAAPGAARPDGDELQRHLRTSLPEHMVPSIIAVRDALPMTRNGKVDRAQLASLVIERPAPRYVAPATATERAIAEMWRSLLECGEVGRDDHFFRIGGHSILAARLTARVRERFAVDLPLHVIFTHPTLAHFAAEVDRLRERAEVLLPIRSDEALLARLDSLDDDEIAAEIERLQRP